MSVALECQREILGDIFQEAINAFHQSIGQAGPYNLKRCQKLPWPVKLYCSVSNSCEFLSEGKCLFFCDKTAYSRVEEGVNRISVIASGVALPHVNLGSEASCIEWFMVDSFSQPSSNFSDISSDIIWFVVDEAVRDLFELLACSQGLAPARSVPAISFQTDVAAPAQLHGISLTVMAVSFWNFFITRVSREGSIGNEQSLSSTSLITVKAQCGQWKGSSDLCCIEGLYTFMELDYHLVMDGVSQPFLLLFNQCHESSRQQELKSVAIDGCEITVKEEPLRENCIEIGATEEPTLCRGSLSLHPASQDHQLKGMTLGKMHGDRSHVNRVKPQKPKHFGLLLRCPKCSDSFKLGFEGQGVGLLFRHVHNSHPRLTTYCKVKIRQQYGHILQVHDKRQNCNSHGALSTLSCESS